MECPQCGAQLRAGAQFCNKCGARVEANTEPPQSRTAMDNWKGTLLEMKWVLLGFVIWCMVTCPCACFLGYRTQWILWKLGLR
jgi:uncharacterized membrane protein YvbJ